VSDWDPPLLALLDLQRRAERGPRREGLFAVWLLVRVALDVGHLDEPPSRADQQRIAQLAQRLAPLAVPRPLARGLVTALSHLRDPGPDAPRIALTQLVAPVRDALSAEAAEAVAHAARLLFERRQSARR
jgi:hypothetical protein